MSFLRHSQNSLRKATCELNFVNSFNKGLSTYFQAGIKHSIYSYPLRMHNIIDTFSYLCY